MKVNGMEVLGDSSKAAKKYDLITERRDSLESGPWTPTQRGRPSPLFRNESSVAAEVSQQGHDALEAITTSWVSKTFMSGCAILLPVGITIFMTTWLVETVDGVFSPIYKEWFGFRVFGLGFLTAVLLIFFSGMLAQSWIGSLFVRMTELVFQKLPFVTVIYSAAKQIGQAIDPQSENAAFKECVLIRHPRHGEYALAFVTGECSLQESAGNRNLVIVYVPTNHMYVGDIFMLGAEDIIHTSLTVGEGLEVVVSMGMAMPKSLKSMSKAKSFQM